VVQASEGALDARAADKAIQTAAAKLAPFATNEVFEETWTPESIAVMKESLEAISASD